MDGRTDATVVEWVREIGGGSVGELRGGSVGAELNASTVSGRSRRTGRSRRQELPGREEEFVSELKAHVEEWPCSDSEDESVSKKWWC